MSFETLDCPLITANELLRMPRGSSRRFLVRGHVVEQPFRGMRAAAIGATLMVSLAHYEEASGIGVGLPSGTGFQIESDPDTVLAPAAAFVKMNEHDLTEGYHEGPPDLAVEVISQLDHPEWVPFAVREWLKAGCPFVVVVDPGPQTVTVYRSAKDILSLASNDVLDGMDVLPGWKLPLSELFE